MDLLKLKTAIMKSNIALQEYLDLVTVIGIISLLDMQIQLKRISTVCQNNLMTTLPLQMITMMNKLKKMTKKRVIYQRVLTRKLFFRFSPKTFFYFEWKLSNDFLFLLERQHYNLFHPYEIIRCLELNFLFTF